MGDESRVLMSLRPVSFKYKAIYDPSGAQQYGLIAERPPRPPRSWPSSATTACLRRSGTTS